MRGRERFRGRQRVDEGERGGRKKYLNNKIQSYSNRVNVLILEMHNVIEGLMGVDFEQKFVK